MEAVKQKPEVDLEALRRTYDEHEVRTATYLGRDLNEGERTNLAIDGLAEVWKVQLRPIGDFEKASELMAAEIRKGETVGAAIQKAIRSLDEEA